MEIITRNAFWGNFLEVCFRTPRSSRKLVQKSALRCIRPFSVLVEFKGGSWQFWWFWRFWQAPCAPFASILQNTKYSAKRQPWRFWRVLAVSAVVAASVVTATPLKLNPPFPTSWATSPLLQSRDSTVATRKVQGVTVPSSRVTCECHSLGLRSSPLKIPDHRCEPFCPFLGLCFSLFAGGATVGAGA